MSPLPDSDSERLVEIWSTRARRSESAHYQTAAKFAVLHTTLTTSGIILSSVTASGLFASRSTSGPYHITFGILGVLAGIVAGLDRSQRYAERAEQHRVAGAGWAVIVNETEELVLRRKVAGLKDAELDALRKRMDEITQRSPQLPQNIFKEQGLEKTYLFGKDSQAINPGA